MHISEIGALQFAAQVMSYKKMHTDPIFIKYVVYFKFKFVKQVHTDPPRR